MELDVLIRLSLQKALLGAVTPNLRAVSFKMIEKDIFLYFIYNNQPSEEEEELAEVVGTEVISDFSDETMRFVEVEKIVCPYPERIPGLGRNVYHCYEPTPPGVD